MRRRPAAAFVASLVLLGLVAGVPGRPSRPQPQAASAAPVVDALASLPLAFEPNVGQAEAGVDFVARGPGFRLALTAAAADISLAGDDRAVRMHLVGSDPAAKATPGAPLPGRTNYLTGSDPSAWRTGVATFGDVTYRNVWPGVDVVYLGEQRRLRHDFVVAPGSDPSAIAVDFGAPATVDPATGDLLVAGARLSRPTVFQQVGGARQPVDGRFRVDGNLVGFDIGAYDRTRTLVIDPTLVTSSYLGGSGTDNAAAVDVDGGGNVYIVGSTESSDFRATNPFQNTLNGDGSPGRSDAFVAKLSADGTSLLYATYLGGSNRDAAAGVAVAADGSVYVTGVTESEDFPRTDGVAQGAYGGGPSDAFVTKLNPAGSGLAWSTFVGGAETDAARAVAVSAAGEAFVTGSTNSIGFPTANPFQQATPQPDDVDAFVTKISSDGTTLAFSTRLGGSNEDRGLDIAVDATGNAYVTGDTRSPGFPTNRPLQPGAGGSANGVAGSFSDAFVSKLGPAGNNLVYSTFLGGNDTDQGGAIVVDTEGAAYVTGTTNSPNFPVKAPLQARKDTDTDAFVTQINPAGSELVYSTYLGGGGADSGTGIMVDRTGSVTVVGVTGSSNFPTAKPVQGVKGGGATDAFVSTLAAGGGTLVSSSYLGGREDDVAAGVAVGPGAATPVVVGSTSSADFPTAKPLQSARAGATADAFVTRVSAAEEASPATTVATGDTVAPAAPARSSTHDRRVRLLVATTAGLFLIAVLQTAYLRRKAVAESAQWGPEQPAPLVPPPPVQTWGGGVRVIEDEVDDKVFASVVDEEDRSEPVPAAAGSTVAVPDILDEDWVAPPPPPQSQPLRPAPRVPLEELSFWDLFPEDLPPSRRPEAIDDADWALEDQEDVLVGPGPTPPPPPPPPPPPVPNPWADAAPPPPPPPPPQDDNLLLTELLDLSPAATQAANAAHYGSIVEAGGGSVRPRPAGDAATEDDAEDDGDAASGPVRAAGATKARSGSGTGSRPAGSGGPRKARSKRGGKRPPRPPGGQGGGPGPAGGGTAGGGAGGGRGTRPAGDGGAGQLGG